MKKALLILLLVTFSTIVAQDHKINWLSIEEVEVLQQKEPRKVLMDVYTTWCGPCKMMMRNTFTNKDVINYVNKNFYAVKFDAESGEDVTFKGTSYKNPSYNPNARRKSPHQFAQALGISSYPTIIYMDEEMNIIAPIKGYQTPGQFEAIWNCSQFLISFLSAVRFTKISFFDKQFSHITMHFKCEFPSLYWSKIKK